MKIGNWSLFGLVMFYLLQDGCIYGIPVYTPRILGPNTLAGGWIRRKNPFHWFEKTCDTRFTVWMQQSMLLLHHPPHTFHLRKARAPLQSVSRVQMSRPLRRESPAFRCGVQLDGRKISTISVLLSIQQVAVWEPLPGCHIHRESCRLVQNLLTWPTEPAEPAAQFAQRRGRGWSHPPPQAHHRWLAAHRPPSSRFRRINT